MTHIKDVAAVFLFLFALSVGAVVGVGVLPPVWSVLLIVLVLGNIVTWYIFAQRVTRTP